MKTKVNILQSDFIMEQCDNLAREGLRTLVITSKDIEKEEFDKWQTEYKNKKSLMKNREAMVKQ